MIDRDFDYTELQPDGPRCCEVRECDQTEEDGPLSKCIECSRHVCALDSLVIGPETYCKTCGVCSQCQRPAITGCTECGVLLCEAHATPTERCAPCGEKVTA